MSLTASLLFLVNMHVSHSFSCIQSTSMPSAPPTDSETISYESQQDSGTKTKSSQHQDVNDGGTTPAIIASTVCCSVGIIAFTAFFLIRRRRKAKEVKDSESTIESVDNTLDEQSLSLHSRNGGVKNIEEYQKSHLPFLKNLLFFKGGYGGTDPAPENALGSANSTFGGDPLVPDKDVPLQDINLAPLAEE